MKTSMFKLDAKRKNKRPAIFCTKYTREQLNTALDSGNLNRSQRRALERLTKPKKSA